MRRTLALLATAALIVVGSSAASPSVAAPADSADDPTLVRTDAGWVRGRADGDVVRFSGVPYAASPAGTRRWTAPRPREPWTGVLDATTEHPGCPRAGFDAEGHPTVDGVEDCLRLDVVRPRRAGRSGRLPVVVWVHGGNFVSGAAREYDGARLAVGGDVVVVTVSYRLGALGFLSSPALDRRGPTSGGYGLQDQAQALRWVRRNIGAFGGDPRRVTLAGQSAGARSVCAHLASPTSRGLFDRAVLQSGACAIPVATKSEADRWGVRAVEQLGCGGAPDVAACLRAVPVEDLVRALSDVRPPVTAERREDAWGPVAGTRFLPRQPIRAIRGGSAAGVPLLLGSTHDEMRAFVLGRYADLTAVGYAAEVEAAFGDAADRVLRRYPADDYDHPALALATVLTDWGGGIGACPVLDTARVASRHAPVHAYELREESPAREGTLPYGAHHNWDLPFLMDTSIPFAEYPPLSPSQERLSEQMIGYWTTFARRGHPNGAARPAWPVSRPGRVSVLGLAANAVGTVDFAADHRCGFWRGLR